MINIKQGLRRIGIVFLILANLWFLLMFILSGFIFWESEYIGSAEVYNKNNPNIKIDLIDFSRDNFEKKREWYLESVIIRMGNFGFTIHPYKRYFKNWDGVTFKDNEHIKVNNEEYIVKLPSAFSYLKNQIWQFLLIPLCDLLIIGFYLLIEFILCWIIKGFKIDKD
ncbi:MAG: hypothetical protein J6S67_20925 [Methanobrevibacter sp.]|nr:hypothetical protein [Methanobrevibacter sp.]